MKLKNKTIRTSFPSGRVILCNNVSSMLCLDLIHTIPSNPETDVYDEIELRDFVEIIAAAAYEEGVKHGTSQVQRDLKKIIGL